MSFLRPRAAARFVTPEPEPVEDEPTVDLALDVRLILDPPPADAEPVAVRAMGIRPSVPVVPGRAS